MSDVTPPRLSELAARLDQSSSDGGKPSPGAPGTEREDRAVLVLGDSPLGGENGLFGATSSRRAFLTRASTLSLALPGLGAALSACSPGSGSSQGGAAAGAGAASDSGLDMTHHNSNSKLDTTLFHDVDHGSTSSVRGTGVPNVDDIPYRRYDPTLPPPPESGTLRLHWRAQEIPVRIAPDTVVAGWVFEGDIPGPIVHCRVGDTVEFTLTNDGVVPHSMDFHSAQIDPKVAFRSVPNGESVSFTFRPKYAGAYMYHCGTAPVLMHIGAGMYGAMIVSPRQPLPAAREFVLVQSEFYLGEANNGIRPFDYDKMLSTLPDFLAFNGRPNQYIDEPIRVKVGERVRFWVVNCGPTHPCAFHVVGEQFDTMYLGAPPDTPIRGVQTWDVPAGGGMVFDLECDIPGEFPFVNHGFGHGQKGAIGFLVVEP